MSKDQIFNDTITGVARLRSSVMGNPAWLVHFENHAPMRTMSDTGWSYEANNPEWRNAYVMVVATPAGRIRYCRHAKKTEK